MSNRQTFPTSLDAFDKQRKAFEAWLVVHGSAVKTPTNPYEVIRFAGSGPDCVVYRKGSGKISHWTPEAAIAFQAFLDRDEWRAVPRGSRDRKTMHQVASLAARDGWACCYCLIPLDMETATIEHFMAITSGGTSHMANLSLACEPCNRAAGHLSVRAKIELAMQKRSAPCPALPPSS